MSSKRVLVLLIFAFAVFYILRSPDSAANALKFGGTTAVDGIKQLAESLAKFLDTLFA